MITVTKLRELNIAPAAGGQLLHISAASGLVQISSTIYVVADDELHLGVFSDTGSEPGRLIRLFDGELPRGKADRKRQKPDLEALTRIPAFGNYPHGALLALGSGSRPNRCRGALLELDSKGTVCGPPIELDMSCVLTPLYREFAEPNIEGAVIAGDGLRLFQRANKAAADNAIIHYPMSQFLFALEGAGSDIVKPSAIQRISIDSVEGVPFSFTDAAVLPNGDIIFCAVAENSKDAYRDGPCIGAGVGTIDPDGRLQFFERLDRPYKVEGIDVRQHGDRISLLLVTDADDPAIPASLLCASL
jgi:hypothetical protein